MTADDEPQAPPGVGPHSLHELELMLAGTKPAAMFGEAVQFRDIIPEDDFAPHVAAGRIIKREYYWDDKSWAIPSSISTMHYPARNGASMHCMN